MASLARSLLLERQAGNVAGAEEERMTAPHLLQLMTLTDDYLAPGLRYSTELYIAESHNSCEQFIVISPIIAVSSSVLLSDERFNLPL